MQPFAQYKSDNALGRIQQLLDGWRHQSILEFDDPQDFANAFIAAEFVDDPAEQDDDLSIDLVQKMAIHHWGLIAERHA